MKNTILILSAAFLIFSCDKVEISNIIEGQGNGTFKCDQTITATPTQNIKRRILLEDFTGHTCGNCPPANTEAQLLEDANNGQVVVVSIHAGGNFADPDLTGTSCYDTDYRTESGEIYEQELGVLFNPIGFVNRKDYNGNLWVPYTSWGDAIDAVKNLPAEVDIRGNSYMDTTENAICVNLESEFLADKTGTYNLIIYLLEDSIVDCQKNGNTPIEDYLHRHVLRDNINGIWGDQLTSVSAAENQIFTNHYSYTIANNEWNKKQLSVVAYVCDMSTYEVLQVYEEHLEHHE